MPRPSAESAWERGATMPTMRVPLLVSQAPAAVPPPSPAPSSRFVPQAVSPRVPARIAAVTIVRLRVMLCPSVPRYRVGV